MQERQHILEQQGHSWAFFTLSKSVELQGDRRKWRLSHVAQIKLVILRWIVPRKHNNELGRAPQADKASEQLVQCISWIIGILFPLLQRLWRFFLGRGPQEASELLASSQSRRHECGSDLGRMWALGGSSPSPGSPGSALSMACTALGRCTLHFNAFVRPMRFFPHSVLGLQLVCAQDNSRNKRMRKKNKKMVN